MQMVVNYTTGVATRRVGPRQVYLHLHQVMPEVVFSSFSSKSLDKIRQIYQA